MKVIVGTDFVPTGTTLGSLKIGYILNMNEPYDALFLSIRTQDTVALAVLTCLLHCNSSSVRSESL